MFDPQKPLGVNKPKKPKKLTTIQYATIIEALNDGEIEGFPAAVAQNFKLGSFNYAQAAKKNIFLNGTPILKPSTVLKKSTIPTSEGGNFGFVEIDDNDFNFKSIGVDFRKGVGAQGATKTGTYVASNTEVTVDGFPTFFTTITISNHGYSLGDVLKIDYTNADGQPFMNDNGTFFVKEVVDSNNFKVDNKGVILVGVPNSNGTCSVFLQAQQPLDGINQVETPVNSGTLGTVITKENPVTIQVPHDANNLIDQVRVTISADQFSKKNGGATLVIYKIEIVDNDGTVFPVIDSQYQLGGKDVEFKALSIKGKTSKPFSRDHIVSLAKPQFTSYTFPVSIKVSRITDDKGALFPDKIKFSGLSTIILDNNAYEGIAHLALRFDSQQFPSLPKRSFLLRGKKIAIPSNSTVDSKTGGLTFSGTFDGTLKTVKEWCACPAFVLYDILTSELSDFIDSTQLDVYSFYNASVYCNELVENLVTEGEKEPRFSFNSVISDQQSAFDVINNICSNFRAVPFFSEGLIKINQDRPQTTPDYIFNRSNVTDEGFSYSGTDVRDRANKVSVSFFDKTLQKNQYVTVDLADLFSASSFTNDTNAKLALGVIHKKIDAFGCTSFGQAKRLARFILFEDQRSTETINFETTITEGVLLQPNQIIGVNDPMKAGVRRGGRIVSATNSITSTIVVDDIEFTDIPTTNTPTISVILPDGTLESGTISGVSGATISVNNITRADGTTGASTFTTKPEANSVFVVENTSVALALYRVLTVKENTNTKTYAVNAITYHSDKYDFIETFESDLSLQTAQTTVLNQIIDPPQDLSIQEQIYAENGQLKSKITISWQPVLGAANYKVAVFPPEEDSFEITTQSTSVDILNAQLGEYDIDVFSLNGAAVPSGSPIEIENFEVVGKITPPDDITGLTVEPVDKNFVKLHWNKSEDISMINGGSIYIKHTNLTTGGSFQNSSPIIDAVSGTSTEAVVPNLAGTYVIRAKDSNGTFSENAQTVQFTLDDSEADDQDTITNINEDGASFGGTKTGCTISPDGNGLEMILAGDGLFDDETDFDTLTPNLDQIGDTISTTGTYEFTTTGDLGANNKMPTHFIKNIAATTFLKNTEIDTRNQVDLFSDIDGTKVDEPKVDLFVATTDDDPSSGSPTFTAFEKFSNATFKGRGYKFKAVFTSTKPDENIKVTTLRATGSLAPRTETQRNGTFVTNPFQATYTASGGTTTITVASTTYSHGLSNGDSVIMDFTSGDAVDGTYTITVINTTRFTVTAASSLDTSGNCTFSIPVTIDSTTGLLSSRIVGLICSFGKRFKTPPTVNVFPDRNDVNDASNATNYQAVAVTETSFNIRFSDGNDNLVDRSFSYSATGFGKGDTS